AQIDSGVDLILANGDNANVGAIEAAKENGKVYAIGWTRDQAHLAPDLVLTSVEQRVDNILIEAIEEIKGGTIEWTNHVVGFKEQAQTLAPFNEVVPEDVATEVNAIVEALVNEQITLDDNGNVTKDEYHTGEATGTGSSEEAMAEADFSGLKVALLTSGPINDEGWNQTAYEGLKAVEAAGAEIANTENVAQADQLDLIRSYADQGFNVIVGHGFEYGDALTSAAGEYPEVSFIQIGGIAENGKNLVSYVFKPGEGGYAAGILAGHMSPTGKIGGVGAVEIPTIAADFNAFKTAAQLVNPEITDVPVAYTGSWVDIPKAKEAAIAQIDSGVDLILANGDNANVGAIEAAKENGKVYAIGWTRDQAHLAPDLVLTSMEQRVDNILIEAIKEIKGGTIEWTNHVVGFADGAQTFAPFNKVVPEDAATEVNAVIEALISGQIVLDDNGNVTKDEYHK
ncbi:MAG: BMP family ABC transporter substrate-binding protein, partial [Chloroflexi bacterium]|nr:BMP family ABC transporter substrate-binding protein [Chloroflexota bacterium]